MSEIQSAQRGATSVVRTVRRFITHGGPLVALVALVVFFTAVNPVFLSFGNLAILLSQMAIPLVIVSGLTIVIIVGGIDLSIEGVVATSSLVFVLTAANDRNGSDLGMLAGIAGIATGAIFGLVNGVLNVKLRIPSFMATLGMGAVGIGVATVLFGGRAPRLMDDAFRSVGAGTSFGIANLFCVAMLVFFVAWLVQRFTRIGRYAYVIGGDERIAHLSGLNVGKYKIAAFIAAGTTSGIAGVLLASQLGIGSPVLGQGVMFTSITAVVLGGTLLTGGRGGVVQSLVGVAIITVLANGLIIMGVNPYVQVSVQGVVIIAAVVATGWRLRSRVRVVK